MKQRPTIKKLNLELIIKHVLNTLPNFRFLENPRSSTMFNESYRASHMRATPFFVGVAMSLIINKLKQKKIKFSSVNIEYRHICYSFMNLNHMDCGLYVLDYRLRRDVCRSFGQFVGTILRCYILCET